MQDLMKRLKGEEKVSFDFIKISLASPEMVTSWSHGEVKKPETINYRTFKPEKDGLFCEKIFGPVRDWVCNCGKYKGIKHKGVICDRCGVEVTQAKVRRERMGHIELATPVSHIWFFKGTPSRIGYVLDIPVSSLERVLYYEDYIVVDPGKTDFHKRQLLSEEEHRKAREKFGDAFLAKIGAEGIRDLLREVNVGKLSIELKRELKDASVLKKKKIIKRLNIVEAFRKSGNLPEWMIMDIIPVLPAELRPLVPLDGGRFATSDLNDLYRRVINRNNRLKKLIELRAPDVIIRNEKRMLQEAVDALFDNGRRGQAVKGPGKRPLKSLSSMLRGKQGRFRQNLLGKRVDYSGRSVIVVGPELKLNQCGLPKKMALELFKPFIIRKLDEKGFTHTIKSAKKMVEDVRHEVWDILEEVVSGHTVFLNRAPTLHRLGIQSFEPILIDGKAIQIHPLVCAAFNADFDGDQMAVHVPLSIEAQIESKVLLMATNNILSPSNGKPIIVPTQDMVLGCFYLTSMKYGEKGEGRVFSNPGEVDFAYESGELGLHARIKVRIDGKIVETTTGRVIFNQLLPEDLRFVNKSMDKGALLKLVTQCYHKLGQKDTVLLLDKLKDAGFGYATSAGISISVDDMLVPKEKKKILDKALLKVHALENQYRKGIITDGERHNKVIDTWTHATDEITDKLFSELSPFNSIFMMNESGSRGSKQQIRQLAGMRGLMAKPSGEIIESPIMANFREGLTVLEYFISTHGGRKGLADTALKTADSGYLTRRLVDVAQDAIIVEDDCGTVSGIKIEAIKEAGEVIEELGDRVLGRVVLDNIVDPITDELILSAGEEVDEVAAARIEKSGIERIRIRSVLTCESRRGVCAKCYGRNLANGRLVDLGEAVGVIAAQSIGEPGTQLTMRTFHIGGTASRVVEQSRIEVKSEGVVNFHNMKVIKKPNGVTVVLSRQGEISVSNETGRETERHTVFYGAELMVEEGGKVKEGDVLVQWDSYNILILNEYAGKVVFKDIKEGITMREELDRDTGLKERLIVEHKEESLQPQILIVDKSDEVLARYPMPIKAHMAVNNGDTIAAGDVLAKIPRETTKTKDITGGLPRVAELFEARRPKEYAIISEIDGVVRFAGISKGLRKIVVYNEETNMEKEYFIAQGKHLTIREGDRVKAGEQLMDGSLNLHDILQVKGVEALQRYLVDEVQEVYRLQGVNINDKHIEIIVRQMLRKVKIEDSGDTSFLSREEIDKIEFREENERVIARGGQPATAKPILLGITKASLRTESFISAASFQETTRVLTEAAISGKCDFLRGLKENVVIGHLIPAGTGMEGYICQQ